MRRLAVKGLILGCAAGLQISCKTAGRSNGNDARRLGELREELQALVQPPSCSAVTQCRVIPVGAKPCGGPWSYQIYSTATSDSATLARAVARYNALEADINRRTGRASDCTFVTPPVLGCLSGRCGVASGTTGTIR